MEENEKKYYLGLDIGTNSCGYAVTDENYNIIKAKGKKLWGVRLFDEASTAEERRMKRASRRRLDRRKLKIAWLQKIFKSEIDKLDPQFLTRIQYSNLFLEDKILMNGKINSKDSLFNDITDRKKYTDKEFYQEYPTIYHLRKELLTKPAKDVRFLYLALHNIVKRRGNFLSERNLISADSLKNSINDTIEQLYLLGEDVEKTSLEKIDDTKEKQISDLLIQNRGIRQTKLELYKIFNINSKNDKAILDIFIDGKINLQSIFPLDLEEKIKLDFEDENYEIAVSELEGILNEDQLILLDKLKMVYSTIQLKKILTHNAYICEAMVDIFEEHKKQLREFKSFVKKFYRPQYYHIFRNPQNKKNQAKFTNYPLYVGLDSFNGTKHVLGLSHGDNADRTKESFYKYIKSILSTPPCIKEYNEEEFLNLRDHFLSLIDNDNFLPKLRTKNNSVFPNALYIKEAEKILQTNLNKFEFLSKKDESNLTNVDKILSIIKFRVPYFVGPIGTNPKAESNFAWTEKEYDLPMTPWNLDKIVDFDKAENNFIIHAINKCTYLPDRDVLPKHSLLYSRFRVLNELNNLKLDGNEISIELKQNIYNDLFKTHKRVTVRLLKDYLVANGYYTKDEVKDLSISGIDKEFKNQLSSYIDLKNRALFSEEFLSNNIDVFENIIKYHTIISDKNRLIRRIRREYPNLFNDEQLKVIKSLNYSGWGHLSEEFLSRLKFTNKLTGEITCTIDELWNTNKNLQEIIFDTNYTLNDELLKHKKELKQTIDYQDVMEMYCSPSVKRAVWQAIRIVNEIISLMGRMPEHIFVEVTRHDETKGDAGRKLSRQDSLKKIYQSKAFLNSVQSNKYELDKLMDELSKTENNCLRSEKLYLYFLQLGRCAYSGEPIDIKDLYNEHKYDVDHIIPQSLLKDDSIDNKVLVKGEYNKAKSDSYPIYQEHPAWVENQIGFWKLLKDKNLMSKSKYDRLIRKTPLTEDELGGFIARQLVETNQTNKAVIDLLKSMFNEQNKVIYSKARFVSEFRNKYKIHKSREINDLHHAKDAYLNIVVGNILYSRFTSNPRNFYKLSNANTGLTKNTKKLYDNVVKSSKGDKIVWNGESDIARIKSICELNDCLVSKMSYTKMNGAFYKETIHKSKINNTVSSASIPLKGDKSNPLNNYEKYGGYSDMFNAYFILVESEDKKGNKIKTIESVPILIVRKFKDNPNKDAEILNYVAKENKLNNPKIIIPKINLLSTIRIGKGEYLLSGKTGSKYVLHNFNQWFLDNKTTKYVKAITKYIEIKKAKKDDDLEEIDKKVIISKASKDGNDEIALTEHENLNLYSILLDQLNKAVYEGSQLKSIVSKELADRQNIFCSLSVKDQAEALYNIIKRLHSGATPVDLTLLGGPANVGKITINKNITNKNLKLVLKSPTGVFEKVIKM